MCVYLVRIKGLDYYNMFAIVSTWKTREKHFSYMTRAINYNCKLKGGHIERLWSFPGLGLNNTAKIEQHGMFSPHFGRTEINPFNQSNLVGPNSEIALHAN